LPPQYAELGFKPEPWSELDSMAIAIRLFQEFGKGGAGELRNLAFLQYLKTQPPVKDRILDVFDDFAWQNDHSAPVTVAKEDDTISPKPHVFAPFDRAVTEARLAEIPMPSLFDLFPAIRLAQREDSHRLAERLATPFRTGSYCLVVAPKRSGSGRPLLLSGPQMGFTTPSILHEMSISAPSFQVAGADIPGVPGIVIGHTPKIAWGITSGEADTEDIVWSKLDHGQYIHNGVATPFTVQKSIVHVKGEPDRKVQGLWTESGPVVLRNDAKGVVFSRHSAYRYVEFRTLEAMLGLYTATKPDEIEKVMSRASMNFNFFYATDAGDIGYRYLGLIPERAPGLDPRLPTPDEARFAWRGFVPFAQMPYVRNPKSGLLSNWNNKPADWWPNGDTPDWGRIFPVSVLRDALTAPKLSPTDLEMAVWRAARTDETWPYFKREALTSGAPLVAFTGLDLDGSAEAGTYKAWFASLRQHLIAPTTGNFLDPSLFEIVAQPTTLWNALHGKTKVDYLRRRTIHELTPLPDPVKRFTASAIRVPGDVPIPYANRGTWIQVVEFEPNGIFGRTVLTPGVAESGDHSRDQVSLARAWLYKPLTLP
jgi:penicillin amidase